MKSINKKNPKPKKLTSLNKPIQRKIRDVILCESCEIQCAGHGGGTYTYDGRCLCNDGSLLECI
jgi:hypothetical protein